MGPGFSRYELPVNNSDDVPGIFFASSDLIANGGENEDIYVTNNGTNVVIRWEVEQIETGAPVNAEVVLYDNGNFQINYGDNPSLYGDMPTYSGMSVGIGDGSGILFTRSVLSGLNNSEGEFNNPQSLYWGEMTTNNPSSTSHKKFTQDTRCLWTKPATTEFIRLTPATKNGVKGMNIDWTQYDADKIYIKIDDGTGSYPWKIDNISNDGHEFLSNVTDWQNVKLFPYNHCKKGVLSSAVSHSSYPNGWYKTTK